MINTKIVKLAAGKEITVTEVKVKRVLNLLPMFSAGQKEDEKEGGLGIADHLQELLTDATGMALEDLQELRSSEIEALWLAFQETNSFFFRTITRFNLEESVGEVLRTLLTAFGGMFANLLSEATLDVSNMDLVGSLQLGKTASESGDST